VNPTEPTLAVLQLSDAFERVWATLREIPAGGTLSYEALAMGAGRPGAQRAAGTANGANRIAFESDRPLAPRSCQCGFCRRHGARTVSDPDGVVTLILADFIELGDVGVRQLRRRARILDETLALLRIAGDVLADHLDRDGTAEPCVARAQHVAEAAGADALEDLVLTERLDHVARLY